MKKCEKANINIWYKYKKIWENKMTDTLNEKTTTNEKEKEKKKLRENEKRNKKI